jgi:Protein kinase domain
MSEWTVPGYTEQRALGRGASGRVVLAIHDGSGRQVAIKYLIDELVQDQGFLARFRQEAELLLELNVPHVVRLIEYVEDPGRGAAIVMELVPGSSLYEIIDKTGPTSPEAALTVLKGSLLGLAAAHDMGVVHRDYKPENVLVDISGNSKLADFGIAVKAGRRVPSAGTPLYMAPEQWAGEPASPATDIYAATAVFYECLTGTTPYTGRIGQLRREHETAHVPVEEVDVPLRGLVRRGMAKDPQDRPADATHFVAELEQVALAAYGIDWEERGEDELKDRSAAAGFWWESSRPPARPMPAASALTVLRRHKAAVAVVAAVALLAAATGVALAAGAIGGGGHTAAPPPHHHHHANPPPAGPVLLASASVTPPTVTRKCKAHPASFVVTGTITAHKAGTVTYRWVLSDGKTTAPATLTFTAAGAMSVTGPTIKATKTSSGWARLKTTSPDAVASNKATYQLTCLGHGHKAGGISAVATVTPLTSAIKCTATPTTFNFAGSITSTRKVTVSYHWSFSNGSTSPVYTMKFTGKGTHAVVAATFKPPAHKYMGSASIIVTSPVSASSNSAAFTLSCANTVLSTSLSSAPSSPASFKCGSARPGFTITGTISATLATKVTYHWVRSNGTSTGSSTVSIGNHGTQDVTDHLTPSADKWSGGDTLDITSPVVLSRSISVSVSCTGSSVIAVSVTPGPPPTFTGNTEPISYVISVTTSGTAAVNVSWTAWESPDGSASGTQSGNGSFKDSGSTNYSTKFTVTYNPGCGAAFVDAVLVASAKGTNGKTVTGSSSIPVSWCA